MQVRRQLLRLLPVALVAPLTLVGAATPATASEPVTVIATTALPLPSYADIVADAPSGRVFISGGRGTTSIVVADLDGQIVGSVDNQQGATALALSADGGTLYATLGDADSVSAVNVTTLAETGRYAIGTGTCPSDLALAGGRIWFSYGCGQEGRIGSLDLSGPAPVVALDQAGQWYYPPLLASASATNGVLAAGQTGTSPAEVKSYDVSSGTPVLRGSTREAGSFLGDVAVEPDGTRVLVSTYDSWYPLVFSAADMSQVGYYASHDRVSSIAVRPDGRFVTGSPTWVLDSFTAGNPGAQWTWYGGLSPDLARRGLALAANDRIYAVGSGGFPPVLRVLVHTPPGPQETFLSGGLQTWPAVVRQPLQVAGQLSVADGSPSGVQTLHLTRQDARGLVTLPDVQTDENGWYSFTDVPRVTGEHIYTVRFDGTDTLLPTQYTISFPVARR
ncbi:MAG TPA: hypothetical protein VFM54_08590 [Micromonosporaceae bacterium]|nr:hypothetical protein [Micromonosporaceae bacterium]